MLSSTTSRFVTGIWRWVVLMILASAPWVQASRADEPLSEPPSTVPANPILALDAGGHTDAVPKVRFTRDGRELVTVSKDKTVRIWSVATGEPLRVLRPPIGIGRAGSLYGLSISPDGRTLACGGIGLRPGENPIYLIDYQTGVIRTVVAGHSDSITDLVFSPNGACLASSGADRTVRLWDVGSGQWKRSLEGHTDWVNQVCFSPDGRRLASASFDGTIRLWTVKSGNLDAVMDVRENGRRNWVWAVAWSPDNTTIATGGMDGCVRLWNTDGTLRTRFPPTGERIPALTFTPDSQRLLFTRGQFFRTDCSLLDLSNGREPVRFGGHTAYAWHAQVSPDGALAATSGYHGDEIFLWRTTNGSLVRRLGGQGRAIFNVG